MADASFSSPSTSSTGSPPKFEADLRVSHQPPPHVFLEENFSFDVQLVSDSRAHKESPSSAQHDTLHIQLCCDDEYILLDVISVPLVSLCSTRGTVQCRVQSRKTGKTQSLQPCSFHIECTLTGVSQHPLNCKTARIRLVEYKIRIVPDHWDDVWYKDEGGREKGLEAKVSIVDAQQELVSHVEVPLQLSLYYQNKLKVIGQDLLRPIGNPDRLAITPQQPETILSVRIEDVSKNHQGQNFIIKVSALKTHRIAPFVGEAFAPPVNVRSKRSKRAKMSQPRSRLSMTPEVSTIPTFSVDARLRDAIGEIIRWSEDVVNGLYALQWQPSGYPTLPDGSLDYARPYYSPNPFIGNVLQTYTESTRGHLQTLHAAFSAGTGEPPGPFPLHEVSVSRPYSAPRATSAFTPRPPSSNEMEYVLACQYTSMRTSEKLGFPVYSHAKQLLGFYQTYEGDDIKFCPLQDPNLQDSARRILHEELTIHSGLVHRLSLWGSLQSMLDHCVAYDFEHQFHEKERIM